MSEFDKKVFQNLLNDLTKVCIYHGEAKRSVHQKNDFIGPMVRARANVEDYVENVIGGMRLKIVNLSAMVTTDGMDHITYPLNTKTITTLILEPGAALKVSFQPDGDDDGNG